MSPPTPQPQARQTHWDEVYASKPVTDLSWYEASPQESLQLIGASNLAPADAIIDIGGGTSTLVDQLLASGFEDVTLLDVSGTALQKVRERLGPGAREAVTFLEQDVIQFEPKRRYALWHDRAVFHFLVKSTERARYVEVLRRALRPGGYLVMATFGPAGPQQCSGLPVMRYGPDTLSAGLGTDFRLIDSRLAEHLTPRGHAQQFLYCRFVHETGSRYAPA